MATQSQTSNIKVVCRFRPPNSLEIREGGEIVVQVDDDLTTVKLKGQEGMKGPDAAGFTFDRVFSIGTQQEEVFEFGVRGIVDEVINGYNGTVFAYGQTGSGKTFTMMGSDIDDPNLKGIIPRITEQIFASIMSSPPNLEYLVKVSYMEIYMERIRDLLAPQNDNLQIHEEKNRGVYVKGLSDYYVGNAHEVYQIMRQGGEARVVSSTNMNAESSRSHSIFVITIQQRNTETGTAKNGNLFLVDLAGSEKVGKTGASGQTLEEAKKINKSLSALGMVINALTDGKSSHIPYRDSKLTRILQESLGGNSRTTLIINCSPSSYNEAETLSTLRFGMRAKSIKNKARINAELSPAELKALLKKCQRDLENSQGYIKLLQAEIEIWRQGGKVDQSEWATFEKVLGGLGLSATPSEAVSPGLSTPKGGRETPSGRPTLPAIDALRELESRPQTPTAVGLEKDERDDFLRRENELADALAEKEALVTSQEKQIQELRDELSFFKEQVTTLSTENKTITTQLNEVRLQLEKMAYENKEFQINHDALRDQNADQAAELEDLRKTIQELKISNKGLSQEGREKKKAEKVAEMMKSFDTGGMSEKEEHIRASLTKLDEAVNSDRVLSSDDIALLKRQLEDSQVQVNEGQERLRQNQDEIELLSRRKEELEQRLATLESEYEDLLDKTIHDEEANNADMARTVQDLKSKLEAQYALKREAADNDIVNLKQQLDIKEQEKNSMSVTIESLRGANEELKRAFSATSAAMEGGKDLAESAKEMERMRKTMASQLSDFEAMKKSLVRDLQNRCEKVCELEISLDETRDQYNNVLKNSNSKAQQKKMDFLTRNLDQLTLVQRQLVEQNTSLKKDVAIAERKLIARTERIQALETALSDANHKLQLANESFEAQMQAVRERLDHAKSQKAQNPGVGLNFGRIAKPLRGGGGGPMSQVDSNAMPAPSPGGRSANAARSSWFFAPSKGA